MKNQTRLWYSYDFANSLASIILLFYFPLVFVEKGGVALWVGLAASLATMLLLLFLPRIGRWADRTGKRILLIALGSVGMSVSLVALAFLFSNQNISSNLLLWSTIFFFILFQFCFQASVSVYTSLLKYLTQNQDNALVSGRGIAFGQLGNLLGIAAVGPLVASATVFIGVNGKPLAFIFGAVLSLIFALPFLFKAQGGGIKSNGIFEFSYRDLLKKISSNRPVFLFLIGIMLLADAILTFQIYITLYFSKVFDFSDKLLTLAAITLLAFSVLGGIIVPRFVHRIGSKMKALQISSLFYAFCFFMLVVIPPIPILIFITTALAGISFSLVFALGRAIYSEIVPHDQQSEYFSIYSIFERAASVVGPVLWAGSFLALAKFGENIQYRGSLAVLIIIALGGYFVLRRVKFLA